MRYAHLIARLTQRRAPRRAGVPALQALDATVGTGGGRDQIQDAPRHALRTNVGGVLGRGVLRLAQECLGQMVGDLLTGADERRNNR
ncbi:MAG TPA: hypothetical protein VIH59_34435 [Candidatus Tectomicrobia bacterium]